MDNTITINGTTYKETFKYTEITTAKGTTTIDGWITPSAIKKEQYGRMFDIRWYKVNADGIECVNVFHCEKGGAE